MSRKNGYYRNNKVDIEQEAKRKERKKQKSVAPSGSELHGLIKEFLHDDFGGNNYKKFSVKKMKELIVEKVATVDNEFEDFDNKEKFLEAIMKRRTVVSILTYLTEVFFEGD